MKFGELVSAPNDPINSSFAWVVALVKFPVLATVPGLTLVAVLNLSNREAAMPETWNASASLTCTLAWVMTIVLSGLVVMAFATVAEQITVRIAAPPESTSVV